MTRRPSSRTLLAAAAANAEERAAGVALLRSLADPHATPDDRLEALDRHRAAQVVATSHLDLLLDELGARHLVVKEDASAS